jgi:hypothetical protein
VRARFQGFWIAPAAVVQRRAGLIGDTKRNGAEKRRGREQAQRVAGNKRIGKYRIVIECHDDPAMADRAQKIPAAGDAQIMRRHVIPGMAAALEQFDVAPLRRRVAALVQHRDVGREILLPQRRGDGSQGRLLAPHGEDDDVGVVIARRWRRAGGEIRRVVNTHCATAHQ